MLIAADQSDESLARAWFYFPRILAAGGTIEYDWSIEDAFAAGDAAVKVPVLTELYGQMKDKPVVTDLDQLWNQPFCRFAARAQQAECR